MNPDTLNSRHDVPGVTFVAGQGGLVKAVVESSLCQAEVFLHGAHVTAFQPTGQSPVLWVSQSSDFDADKPIRGGVPICFPWFGPLAGNPDAPGHGWARTTAWDVRGVSDLGTEGIEIVLTTTIDPYDLSYRIVMGRTLSMELTVSLAATADQPARFEEALHTYLAIGDIHQVAIDGLQPSTYLDKVDGGQIKPASGAAIRFDAECDRVYLGTTATCQLHDPVLKRTIEIAKTNSDNTVVWNPWIAKSARMADFGNDEWPSMVCIETANVGDASVTLQPGESHTMAARIAVSDD
ncbi:Putative glucose-6-phosphate 1-epimerase [Rubripirellula lacrimiformis]|uniref:Putative glucose-6-phosphate 1-epimerase n=1 Tax=Rubripirellula lacrimiformis TaxID=1930273 RepID=A0A517NIB8_9BACT|nr:D-hexose-6-phosphate mutarotase [Rubripirellula lacrimiformis]QDT06879.1 Putative glucose-6-phosphate 1-epimerase [Rubripirellula lacrimiformis]